MCAKTLFLLTDVSYRKMICALRDSMVLHVIPHVTRAFGVQTVMGRVEHVKMRLHVTEKLANVQLRISAKVN